VPLKLAFGLPKGPGLVGDPSSGYSCQKPASVTGRLKSAAVLAVTRRPIDGGACLLVPDLIRAPMARLLKRAAPRLKVLGHSEIPETHTIRIGPILRGA
jgi:flagellar biosynthesis component FlhA